MPGSNGLVKYFKPSLRFIAYYFIKIIELIRDEVLAYSSQLPQAFIQKILAILNRGSIYSNSSESFLDMDSSRKLREMFSKKCFETLLKYSFVADGNTEEVADGTLNNMALASMLNRCKDIMQRYAHDESLNGTVPLPRARTNEMICVLNSLCTLISSLKKAPKECGMRFFEFSKFNILQFEIFFNHSSTFNLESSYWPLSMPH